MRLSVLVLMITFNAVWSAHPAMSKLVLVSVSPAHAAWWRYATAFAAYLLLVPALRAIAARRKDAPLGPAFARPSRARDWLWVSLLGAMSFCFSPLLQFKGLTASHAIDNALIIALEPLIAVLLARVALGERLRGSDLLSLPLALGGFFLLSGWSPGGGAVGGEARLWGNVLMAISLIGEASFSVLGRKLVARYSPLGVFGTALAVGVALLTAAVFAGDGLPDPSALSTSAWLGVLWMGPLGTSLGYLAWMVALKEAPVAAISVTLFCQPVMGTVWGVLFLGERLGAVQWAGAVAILLAVANQARPSRRPVSALR